MNFPEIYSATGMMAYSQDWSPPSLIAALKASYAEGIVAKTAVT